MREVKATDLQTKRQFPIQTNSVQGQTDMQSAGQTERETDKQTDTKLNRQSPLAADKQIS